MMRIRPTTLTDAPWMRQFLEVHWGSSRIVSRGQVHQGELLPGFVAIQEERPMGLLTYRLEDDGCEIVSLDSLSERQGIGTALLTQVAETAKKVGCDRLWLITSNDNLAALRFYQKRGFEMAFIHRHAIDEARLLKPEIPRVGLDGIPVRDEIELERILFP